MALTIAETVVRNWERRRRRLQAHKEGKTLGQVVSEQHSELSARALAAEIIPHIAEELSEYASTSLRESEPRSSELQLQVSEPRIPEREEPLLSREDVQRGFQSLSEQIATLGKQITYVVHELRDLRSTVSRIERVPSPAAGVSPRPGSPPAPGPQKRVPVGDVAGMIDQLSSYYR